ncbi:conserved oligomeric Golgi complex subunit 3 [Onthophagus taurus]|uniref:conserved oligomeric Golgi complex subunit 3 n=1 Tax=Onthophagus taurus TaxID=166361 RepID=UPI0039BDF937
MELNENADVSLEQIIQKNIAKWQDAENPLAPLTDSQWDILYQMEDVVKQLYYQQPTEDITPTGKKNIETNNDFISWMVDIENEMQDESQRDLLVYFSGLNIQAKQCNELLQKTENVLESLNDLGLRHERVVAKTESLHVLSEELMTCQAELKQKSIDVEEKLKYFIAYPGLSNGVEMLANNVNSVEFIHVLEQIDNALRYLENYSKFKETYNFKLKYENLLVVALQNVLKVFDQLVSEASQLHGNENKNLLNVSTDVDVSLDSAFAFYYGKFENAAGKLSKITKYIEENSENNKMYNRTLWDCQKSYFAQRSAIMSGAVSVALLDLKEKHKNDHSILFRSAVLFIIKICQDEATCFRYFFKGSSTQLDEYLVMLCQNLYDVLRPCLINVHHLEVLTELCTILKQMVNDQIQSNNSMDQLVEIIMQLVHDVEERLVFRTNIFFQHDLIKYEPSPGDLAYPEKLKEMEDITDEIAERRTESRMSTVSVDLCDRANVTGNYTGQFRSYTGNSPADLHGMWYPTVKRTLVCLSRLYFCLDKEIFQGLAQEALLICTKTVESAADKISARKTVMDGKLFHIKHLLIIREQIAPFQVDFTSKEMSLDFSGVKTAAVGLIQKRDKLFALSSNNALLEFLLEGTPKVKEYLVDSRKEIDKQLKLACEVFISNATELLIGDLLVWIKRAEHVLSIINAQTNSQASLREQEFGRPKNLSEIISGTSRLLKTKIPDIQKAMRLYLANRETEFILFKPIKNNVLNCFLQVEQIITTAKYTTDDQLLIACPSTEQLNVLICSVSLTTDADRSHSRSFEP